MLAGNAVTPRNSAQVPLVLDGDDQAARLERLRGLLDDLEEIFRPDTHASRTETPQ